MLTNEVQEGKRYRVTLLSDVIATHDDALEVIAEHGPFIEDASGLKRFTVPKITIPAGTVYEGVASDVEQDGFFDIILDNGKGYGFYIGEVDSGIMIEEL